MNGGIQKPMRFTLLLRVGGNQEKDHRKRVSRMIWMLRCFIADRIFKIFLASGSPSRRKILFYQF
jgi:hypothetical protein